MDGKLIASVEDIAESYGSEMLARARRILMSDSDAEDAVQETLLTILSAPHVLGSIDRLSAWLVTLVKRRSIDIIRRESVRKRKEMENDIDDIDSVPNPGEILDRDEAAAIISSVLRKLPEKYREPFVRNAVEGMTFEAMSKETGIPMGTLMARKKKAQDKIRAALIKRGFAM